MRKDKQNQTTGVKTALWIHIMEGVLLVWVTAIATLRATFTETPHVEGFGRQTALSGEAISLLLSAALLAAAAVWVISAALAGRLRWRRTYFSGAVGVFCLFGLAAAGFASDKRAAITDLTVMLSGPAAALLAVQLFNRQEKIRLFLWLLLAVGAAATYTCYDKMTTSSEQLIAEYEKNPKEFLEMFGVEEGSLEHWQYEHRLYGRDVSGFLTTSNSTGSFFLLAIFAGAGLCLEAFGARRGSEPTLTALVCTALATGIVLAGLMMTKSKGAIGSFILFVPVLCIVLRFRQVLWMHRRSLCAALAVLTVGAVAALTAYGLRYGRLPGGNSMLVRWQYWAASTEMAKEYPLLGVGGGNYATHYLKYKEPAAPETINDPHNWVFSLLCRFGFIGLAAMGLAMVRPMGRIFGAVLRTTEDSRRHGPPYGERYLWPTMAAGVLAVMIFIRPGVLQLDVSEPWSMEHSAAFLLLVVIPAGIMALVFGLLRFAGAGDMSLGGTNTRLAAALACGLGAVLLHNLVDFALFEPGVWTMFWLTAGAGTALINLQSSDGEIIEVSFEPTRRRCMALGLPLAAAGLTAVYVVIPPLSRGVLMRNAINALDTRQAQLLIAQAVAVDPLSTNAATAGAQLMKHRFEQRITVKDKTLLDKARTFAETAIRRAPADPLPRRLLGEILLTAAEAAEHDAEKRSLQEAAYAAFQAAAVRYPGSDMLQYRLGVLADELGYVDEAAVFLTRALAIETAYRAQFQVMYPQQEEVISRLGPKAYADLTARLERISQKSKTNSENQEVPSSNRNL